jgi:hypothetical protein
MRNTVNYIRNGTGKNKSQSRSFKVIFAFEKIVNQPEKNDKPEKIKNARSDRNIPGEIFIASGVDYENEFEKLVDRNKKKE